MTILRFEYSNYSAWCGIAEPKEIAEWKRSLFTIVKSATSAEHGDFQQFLEFMEFICFFGTAQEALRAAKETVRLYTEEWSGRIDVGIHCGLHTGVTHGKRGGVGGLRSPSTGTAGTVASIARMKKQPIALSEKTKTLLDGTLEDHELFRMIYVPEKKERSASAPFPDPVYALVDSRENPPDSYKAFISYRRKSGSELARLVCNNLKERGVNTFIDLDDFEASYFDRQIYQLIKEAENFVVILSKGCLLRCGDSGDWFRKEIAFALEEGKHVVPVATPDFAFESDGDLPSDIADLPHHNSIKYSHEYSGAAMDRLMSFLKPTSALNHVAEERAC